jgi:DhnA family fructose-bisphosphate aldolase class Ia
LNVILRWIKLQFQDFKQNPILVTRLQAFLNGDVNRAGFAIEADMIKEALDKQVNRIRYMDMKPLECSNNFDRTFNSCDHGIHSLSSLRNLWCHSAKTAVVQAIYSVLVPLLLVDLEEDLL